MLAPEPLERLEEVARVVLRALEHQVLEQVGEPALAPLLVLRADVIPEVHGDERQVPLAADDHVEAVGERGLGEAEVGRVAGVRVMGSEACPRRIGGGSVVTNPRYPK